MFITSVVSTDSDSDTFVGDFYDATKPNTAATVAINGTTPLRHLAVYLPNLK